MQTCITCKKTLKEVRILYVKKGLNYCDEHNEFSHDMPEAYLTYATMTYEQAKKMFGSEGLFDENQTTLDECIDNAKK